MDYEQSKKLGDFSYNDRSNEEKYYHEYSAKKMLNNT